MKETETEPKKENLYLSKIRTYQECERKGFFCYEMKITPRKENPNFRTGRLFHEVAENLCKGKNAMTPVEKLDPNEKDMILDLLNAKHKDTEKDFMQILLEKKPYILAVESAITIPLNSSYNWIIKVDAIEDNNGTWMDEWKTASGHGPAAAAFYHNSPQTWTYLYNLESLYPNLKGVRFHIATKTKVPILHIEEVFLDQNKMRQAEMFISGAIQMMERAKDSGIYPRSGSNCKTIQKECEYYNLCYIYNPLLQIPEKGIRTSYIDEVLEMYKTYDPEEHLWGKNE